MAVQRHLPPLKAALRPDITVINAENAAGGFGITEAIYQDLLDFGADAVTLGNHAFDQREALVFIERADRLVRPATFPEGTPGRGVAMVEATSGARVVVMNLMGRVFIEPMEDPFRVLDTLLEGHVLGEGVDAIIVDFHAEATSEKQALGHYADGRVSLFVGTHTHAPTADHRVLAGGTAYISDAGMFGNYDSVLGMDKAEPLQRFLHKVPSGRFEPAAGDGSLCGVLVETEDRTGLATRIGAVRVGPHLEPSLPDW